MTGYCQHFSVVAHDGTRIVSIFVNSLWEHGNKGIIVFTDKSDKVLMYYIIVVTYESILNIILCMLNLIAYILSHVRKNLNLNLMLSLRLICFGSIHQVTIMSLLSLLQSNANSDIFFNVDDI